MTNQLPSIQVMQSLMLEALREAEGAAASGEVPVGAVISVEGRIVGRGRNQMEARHSGLAHAEMAAIGEANRSLQASRLTSAILCVTLEPCAMCAGAILLSRIPLIIYAAPDARFGAFGSRYDLSFDNPFGPRPRIVEGVGRERSQALLQRFFEQIRLKG